MIAYLQNPKQRGNGDDLGALSGISTMEYPITPSGKDERYNRLFGQAVVPRHVVMEKHLRPGVLAVSV